MARVPATNDARLTALAAGLVAAALAGCGSAAVAELPPAAGPDHSPALTRTPAGRTYAAGSYGVRGLDLTPDTASSTFRDGSLTATVHPRERTLSITDTATGKVVSEEPAGVGPTHVSCFPTGPCFALDTQGDALLVFRVGKGGHDLRLTRRVYVAGAPYGITLDPERHRLWVTLTARNEVVELPAHGRPHILQRLPTVRQPGAVVVDEDSGAVIISGAEQTQVIPDPATEGS